MLVFSKFSRFKILCYLWGNVPVGTKCLYSVSYRFRCVITGVNVPIGREKCLYSVSYLCRGSIQ